MFKLIALVILLFAALGTILAAGVAHYRRR